MTDDRRFLGRNSKLSRRSQFDHVFQKPFRLSRNGLTILFRENDCDRARIGLVVSRKCSRSAVERNRLKRLIRESFRQYAQKLGGKDIVVIGRPGLAANDNKDIFESLEWFWVQIQKCKSS